MAQPGQEMKFTYVDRPEIPETFVDVVEKMLFDGQVLRLEFCVSRLDEPRPSVPPSSKKVTAARLVMTPNGALDLFGKLQPLIAMWQQQGLIKQNPPMPVDTGSGKPN